jgi:hypothetical protein
MKGKVKIFSRHSQYSAISTPIDSQIIIACPVCEEEAVSADSAHNVGRGN